LNWLDVVLVAILSLSVVGGGVKGFARLVVGLAAAILGLLLGMWFYGTTGGWLLPYVSYPGLANFLGFLLILITVIAAGGILGMILSKLLKWAGLSWVDRILGAVFGLARGAVFAVALVLALMAFARHPPPQSVLHSRLAPYLIGAANACAQVAPHEVRQGVRQSYEKAREIWDSVVDDARKARRKSGGAMIP